MEKESLSKRGTRIKGRLAVIKSEPAIVRRKPEAAVASRAAVGWLRRRERKRPRETRLAERRRLARS